MHNIIIFLRLLQENIKRVTFLTLYIIIVYSLIFYDGL